MTVSRRTAVSLTIALAVIAIDWTSKAIAEAAGHSLPHYTHPTLRSVLVPLVALTVLKMTDSRWLIVAAGLLVGGAMANVGERLLGLPVIDWIWLPAGHGSMLVFNLADVALLGAVVVPPLGLMWAVCERLRGMVTA